MRPKQDRVLFRFKDYLIQKSEKNMCPNQIFHLIDYSLSLMIHYHKGAIRRFCKSYYICIKKLLNFGLHLFS